MPTIKGFEKKEGFRFFFSSHDWGEPAHIHTVGSDGIMKISLTTLRVSYSRGLTYSEERKILTIVEENQQLFLCLFFGQIFLKIFAYFLTLPLFFEVCYVRTVNYKNKRSWLLVSSNQRKESKKFTEKFVKSSEKL